VPIGSVFRTILVGAGSGWLVSSIGAYGYAALSRANLHLRPDVPWSPLVGLLLLWLYWRYLGGAGWPRSTSAYRRRMRRANPIPRSQVPLAVTAATTGYLFVLAAIELAFRLSDLPPGALRMMPTGVPWWTSASILLVLSLVAGVTEEVGFRGYAQKPIEEAEVPALAIVLSALLFTLVHAGKSWFLVQALPMFVAAIWYGYLTYAARSIYPMVALHTMVNVALFLRYEILKGKLPESIHHAGFSPDFWINAGLATGLGAAAFVLAAKLSRNARGPGAVTLPAPV
jgi:membrane protease YdiL (CAAX protease family)